MLPTLRYMRLKFSDNIPMKASILLLLVKLCTCSRPLLSQDSLCFLVHCCFLYIKHDREHNTLLLCPETAKYSEKENTKTKTKLTLSSALGSCLRLIQFVGCKQQQLCSHKQQNGHTHHHNMLFFVVSHWLQRAYFCENKQKKTKYFDLLEFQHWKKLINLTSTPTIPRKKKRTFILKVSCNLALQTIGVDFHCI